jgi:hypothetical protein
MWPWEVMLMSAMFHARRNFLKLTWGVLGVAAVAEAGGVSYIFLSPRTTVGRIRRRLHRRCGR